MSSSEPPPPSSKIRITPDPYEAPASRQSTDAFARAAALKPTESGATGVTTRQEPAAPSLVKAALIGAAVAFVLATITYVVLSLVRDAPP